MISFISSLEIINAVVPDSNIFFWKAASVADPDAVNANGIKTLLAYDLSRIFIKNNTVLGNGPKSLPKNFPDCPNSCKWVFDGFILAQRPFSKALQILKTCVLLNNNLCGKLFWFVN